MTYLGKQKRRRSEQERWASQQPDPSAVSVAERDRREEIRIVAEEIDRLPESDLKRAGALFYRRGLSTSDIAAELDVPVSTVTTWLDRFRGRLRRRLVTRILAHRGAGSEGA